jgi:NAD(P)-dependent dehydrogenase (short-subunit alcohol dehydrogenase family)
MNVALITGGSKGFGRALAADLAGEGWTVVLDGRDAEALAAVGVALDHAGEGEVLAIPGDVADPAHRQALEAAVSRLGRLDLLVNNASTLGPLPMPGLDAFPLDALEQVYRVNVIAPLALVQLVLPLLEASGGAVVNISSDAAVEGYAGWGGYGSSKAALDQVSRVLAAERPALRVYGFDPGDMRTQMHQDAFPGEDISDRPEPETVVPALRRLLAGAPPSGRYRAADIALSELTTTVPGSQP